MLETRTLAPLICWHPGVLDWGIFRVANGAAVLQTARMSRTLVSGDIAALPAGAGACFHGARNEPSRIQYFLVSLDLLAGVFSHSDRSRMASIAAGRKPVLWRKDAGRTADEFARVFRMDAHSSPSLIRCEMLRVLLVLLADPTADTNPAQGLQTARERVADFLKRRPESVLVSHTVGELARFCGCSQRHFSRLFHECSGVCVRERQIQLRLECAGQLLRESNAKIIQVAMDSGYRHIGLFNAMFKKRFGMTPSEWRREGIVPSRVT